MVKYPITFIQSKQPINNKYRTSAPFICNAHHRRLWCALIAQKCSLTLRYPQHWPYVLIPFSKDAKSHHSKTKSKSSSMQTNMKWKPNNEMKQHSNKNSNRWNQKPTKKNHNATILPKWNGSHKWYIYFFLSTRIRTPHTLVLG